MKVIYLSSTELGRTMFEVLQTLNADIVYFSLENEKITNYEEIEYDLGISFLYTHKIPESEFRKGKIWINFHPGPLPEYPGRNVCYHAIMDRSPFFGATLHYMDENFDSGKIIEVKRFPIKPEHTAGDLNQISKGLLVELFEEFVPSILRGENLLEQAQNTHTRYFKQSKINEEIFLSEEEKLRVRALTVAPRFYAYTLINGQKYFFIPEQNARQ